MIRIPGKTSGIPRAARYILVWYQLRVPVIALVISRVASNPAADHRSAISTDLWGRKFPYLHVVRYQACNVCIECRPARNTIRCVVYGTGASCCFCCEFEPDRLQSERARARENGTGRHMYSMASAFIAQGGGHHTITPCVEKAGTRRKPCGGIRNTAAGFCSLLPLCLAAARRFAKTNQTRSYTSHKLGHAFSSATG